MFVQSNWMVNDFPSCIYQYIQASVFQNKVYNKFSYLADDDLDGVLLLGVFVTWGVCDLAGVFLPGVDFDYKMENNNKIQ